MITAWTDRYTIVHLTLAQPNETFRLSHRVLDLRRARMTRNIQLRSKVLHAARNHLHSCNFTEIETPILLRSSPEGAREFLVPTRVHRSASDAPLGATRSTPPLPSPQFYALQQSPQQPKQLLIASGSTQRYFQIAKCFRDEDGRKDRQAEFTQLDVEMAFVSGAADAELEEEGWRMGGGEVKRTVEEFVGRMWNRARECEGAAPSVKLHPCPQRFRVMRWQEAMRRFGSDKPDLRYGLEIHSLVDEIGPRELQATEDWSKPGLTVDMLVYRPSQEAHSLSNKALADVVQKGSGIEAYKCKASSPNEVASVLLRKSAALRAYLHEAEIDAQDVDPSILCDAFEQALSKGALLSQIGNADAQNAESQHSDLCYVFVAGRKEPPEGGGTAMGDLRKRLARVLENKGALELSLSEPAFLWVTEFPLLTPSSAEEDKAHLTKGRRWTSTHHPFTAPMAQDLALLFGSAPSFSSLVGVRKEDAEVRGLDRQEQLARVRGQHYDLVLNGAEVGGGSVRIHCREVQEWLMSEVLQLTTEEIARFSALLNALSVGAPPHGGFALGVDRFLSILIGSQSIRDVIAFPKTGGGGKGLLDMVFESPARLSEKVGVHGREEEDEVLSAYALRTLEKDA
ncbi:Aspartyl-tRNA synthetase, mitochondrial [Ceraceosorus bombacis]|uniref:Aspartyl-tRNA synthetase, mitochondrial n=1 Tax=Ceraceosorus bombacis TaxID=401625 RepID=A0A0P1BDZ6_9BASI|nr:Aspartyl-tRNA synthetase, mitochondrial [Ceraceosorus bombacis]